MTTDVSTTVGSPRPVSVSWCFWAPAMSLNTSLWSRSSVKFGYDQPVPATPSCGFAWKTLNSCSDVRIWQRLEDHGIDDAENRRVRADAKSECEHGHGGEAGIAPEHAPRVAGILREHLRAREGREDRD